MFQKLNSEFLLWLILMNRTQPSNLSAMAEQQGCNVLVLSDQKTEQKKKSAASSETLDNRRHRKEILRGGNKDSKPWITSHSAGRRIQVELAELAELRRNGLVWESKCSQTLWDKKLEKFIKRASSGFLEISLSTQTSTGKFSVS